jgi:3-methyladenine DNA glycosylase AlkD
LGHSWDLCDQCCGNLFDRTPFAFKKAKEWAKKEKDFVRRAGFAMMAWLAVHDKKAKNEEFTPFFSLMESTANDERNFVKNAVNWALRQIGKRNTELHREAIAAAKRIQKLNSKSARWIAADALRELDNAKIKSRLKKT